MFPALVGTVNLYEVDARELYAACRVTKKFVVFPNKPVTSIAMVSTYEPLEAFPGVAVRYAGEAIKKLASSLASLYFSRVTVRFSAMTAP